jgi:hypothetical protein
MGDRDGAKANQHHKDQPYGRGDVAEDPRQQVEAAHRMQAGLGKEPQVLQVALAPTPVALVKGFQRLRRILSAAGKIRVEDHVPSGALDPRGFDEIVAEQGAAQWRRP